MASICRSLDGIPLAIELAAGRLGVISVESLAAHLNEQFDLLTGGYRNALPRHRTLRAMIDWSYDSLSEPREDSVPASRGLHGRIHPGGRAADHHW